MVDVNEEQARERCEAAKVTHSNLLHENLELRQEEYKMWEDEQKDKI